MSQLDKIVAAYRIATQYPAIISARILDCSKTSVNVHSVWVQRVLERQAKTRFRQTVFSDYKTYTLTSPPTDITNELISAHSKSTKYFCVVREIESGKDIKQYLEVWADCSLVKNYDLSALDVHGKIYADAEFGTLEWSPDETKIVYIAEKKVPKSEPFYKQKPKASADKDGVDNSDTVPGKEYDWSQDWGEQLVGKITPVLVVCDIKTDTIDVLSNIPNDVNPAAATWTPDGKGVVAIGYSITPRKLGLIYCTNRPSHVFSLTLSGQYNVLSSNSEQLSVKTPRFNLNGTKLVWLERLAGGPHHSCFKLMSCNWSTKKITTVVDFDTKILQVNDEQLPFYGLYNQGIPSRSWLNDDKTIVLSTPQGGSIHTFAIDTESKDIHYLPITKPFHECVSVLDVCNDVLVCYKSSLNKPGQLFAIKFLSTFEAYDFTNISINEISPSHCLPNSDNFVVEHGYTLYNKPTTIFYGPKNSNCPLIIWPHGGPHSSSLDSFIAQAAFFIQIGFAVLFINYRGSTGLGKDYVESLLGNIGDADVKDVYNAVQSNPMWSNRKLVLYGGSHGGFLVTQLSGQYPNTFKAVSMRNPCIDLLSLFITSDLPDWDITEGGYNYSEVDSLANSKDVLMKLADCSPCKNVHKVQAPTLLLLGEKDLRVPASQGLAYYHLLKKHGVTARVLMYNDCHPLSTVAADMDSSINTALWFKKYTSDDSE
ncbi:acylamino-acid-releasing enzyme isoform X2 [Acyrthosiphon pisum]|uniref:acylaminoacyl-peptidase n=1 Tax=Acyrthosiphon pisum TaxID=7029 RepID=A0A8R2A9U3_ACYPI|nr:acylamino-acid-releasing enzyme isoform X2 [Acyrthosiphon pisum]|eukprot:XP_003247213.1 PREDICTED: acylamino-acid-releasing enzyme isoform X2 [Acyrthosiphon pisum]